MMRIKMTNIFEKASRVSLRFKSGDDLLTVEDLWNLPLSSYRSDVVSIRRLGMIAHNSIKDANDNGFMPITSGIDETLQLQYDILTHIRDVKREENDIKKSNTRKKEQKEKLLEILVNNTVGNLLPADEIYFEKLIDELAN
jgi:hypothetical protein